MAPRPIPSPRAETGRIKIFRRASVKAKMSSAERSCQSSSASTPACNDRRTSDSAVSERCYFSVYRFHTICCTRMFARNRTMSGRPWYVGTPRLS